MPEFLPCPFCGGPADWSTGNYKGRPMCQTCVSTATTLEKWNSRPREERLEALLREVSTAGVELDDPRIGYLTVQIDRVTWNEIKEIAALETACVQDEFPPEVKP